MQAVQEVIDELTATFFSAFTNVDGPAPVEVLYDVCLAEALIVNATGENPAIYNLREFVEPRKALLQGGTLTNFREYEISEQTDVQGRIARRTSRYEKTWIEGSLRKQGAGTKIFAFVLTPQGWKIASVLWYDARRPLCVES